MSANIAADKPRFGLFVRLEAKPGKEVELEEFLLAGYDLAQQEPKTLTWYAVRFGTSSFGIFDTFADKEGREDHLGGPIAAALGAKAKDLLAEKFVIEFHDILAAKLPSAQAEKAA